MIDYYIVQAKIWLMQYVVTHAFSFQVVVWDYTWEHPIMGLLGMFCLFAVGFMAYARFRTMWEDGTFKALRLEQKALLILVMFAPPLYIFPFGYLFDIFFMRLIVGSIFFRFKPWYQDWKFWTASWTFSRMIWLLKDRTPAGKWWHQLLHAIEPYGH
jgi:hypothetical protein